MVTFVLAVEIEIHQARESVQIVLGCLALVLLAGMIAGVLVCARRLRRPTANRKSHVAFILLVSGWLLYGAAASLIKYTKLSAVWALPAVGLFFISTLGSIVVAILGLSEMRRDRGRYREGKGPAITTLVLGGLLICALIGAMGFGLLQGFKQALDRSATARAAEGQPVVPTVFEDLHFSVKPHHPWVKTDVKKLNPIATVGFLRAKPEAYFLVIAEPLPEGSKVTQEILVGVVKANLAKAAADMRVLEEGPETFHGARGISLVIYATIDEIPLIYKYWIHASPRVAYQLITWGHQREHPLVTSEASMLIDSFRLLPPKK